MIKEKDITRNQAYYHLSLDTKVRRDIMQVHKKYKPTTKKKEKKALAVRVLRWSPAASSLRKVRHGSRSMLLVTSRIQNPMMKTATARGRGELL